MSKQTINVKVSKAKLVSALKKALAEKVKEAKAHSDATKAQQEAIANVKKSIIALVKAGKLTPKEVSFPYSYRYNDTDHKEVTVSFSSKVQIPKLDSTYNESYNMSAQNDISNAIRVLEMSDEEFVKTSSYGAVAKYL